MLPVSLLERENALPIVLHADHHPTVPLRLVGERRGESADLGVGQTMCWAVGVLAGGVVVQHKHLHPRAGTGAGPLRLVLTDSASESHAKLPA